MFTIVMLLSYIGAFLLGAVALTVGFYAFCVHEDRKEKKAMRELEKAVAENVEKNPILV